MNPAPGQRKVHVTARTSWFLLAGLLLALIAIVALKLPTTDVGTLYMWYVAGLVGKDTAFMWGNRAEQSQPAKAPQRVGE